jgi:hypothetical protein
MVLTLAFLVGCDDFIPEQALTGLYLLFEPWVSANVSSAGFLADGTGYLVGVGGLLRVAADGSSSNAGAGSNPAWMTSLSDGSVLAWTSTGLQVTTDGSSWQTPAASGLPAAGLTSRVRESEPGVLLAAANTSTAGVSVYASEDWGETWSELSQIAPAMTVMTTLSGSVDHAVSGLIQVNVSGQAFDYNADFGAKASTDGGVTWEDVDYARTAAQWETSDGVQISWGYPAAQGRRDRLGVDGRLADRRRG